MATWGGTKSPIQPTDPVNNIDATRRENNQQYLKDTQDGIRADLDTEEATRAAETAALDSRVVVLEGAGSPQGIGTGDSPTFKDVSLDDSFVLSKSPTSGLQAVTPSTSYVLGEGGWNIIFTTVGGFLSLQTFISGAWREIATNNPSTSGNTIGASIFSDGTNARVTVGVSGGSFYYQRF